MTPSLDAWMGGQHALSTWRDDHDRAYDTERTIKEKPSSIEIIRDDVGTLDAQQVRLEPTSGGSESRNSLVTVSRAGVLITGYKDHPSISDTNIRRGDRFVYNDAMYAVIQVMADIPSRMLAVAEVREE